MSLPTRERGLKGFGDIVRNCGLESLPTRERGLKVPSAVSAFQPLSRSLRGSVD